VPLTLLMIFFDTGLFDDIAVVLIVLVRFTRCSCKGFIQSKSPSLRRLFSWRVLWNNWRNPLY
jgi:hypothetical protein